LGGFQREWQQRLWSFSVRQTLNTVEQSLKMYLMSQIGFLTSRFFTTWLSTLILTWPNSSDSSSSSSFWGWTMLSQKFSQDLNIFLSITKRQILKKKGGK
jgi:hypothetical protein